MGPLCTKFTSPHIYTCVHRRELKKSLPLKILDNCDHPRLEANPAVVIWWRRPLPNSLLGNNTVHEHPHSAVVQKVIACAPTWLYIRWVWWGPMEIRVLSLYNNDYSWLGEGAFDFYRQVCFHYKIRTPDSCLNILVWLSLTFCPSNHRANENKHMYPSTFRQLHKAHSHLSGEGLRVEDSQY